MHLTHTSLGNPYSQTTYLLYYLRMIQDMSNS